MESERSLQRRARLPRLGNLETPSLAIAALIVAAGFLGSRLLGLLRSVIIAEAFGTRPELDAYWVAFRLPDLVFQLLAGATLASAFIPTFAGVRTRQGEAAAWRLASNVLNLVLLATIAFALTAFALAPLLVPLLAPGLGEGTGREAELRDLSVDLTRIMLISPVLFAVSGMFMGILNARRHFLTPALAPMFYNISIILAALVAQDVRTLAVGVVVGAALHLAVQLPDLRVMGMTYRFITNWRDKAVREVGALMGPRVLGLAANQINFYFIAIFFASTVGAGAISAVTFAWLIIMTPIGIIGMAISTAAFPTLAEQAAGRRDELARTLGEALRMIIFLSLPAGLGLAILAQPLVAVLLQRGAFGVESTRLTADALMFYAPALVAHCCIEMLSRGFYALSDTRTPVMFAVLAMTLNLVLAALLVGPMEVSGLALALSLATTVEFLCLASVLGRRVPALRDRTLLRGVGRMVLAAAVTALVVAISRLALEGVLGINAEQGWDALLIVIVGVAAGVGAYVAAADALQLPEANKIAGRLSAMVPRRPRSE